MIDIPTLVCKFVHEFAKGDGVPQYGERQFVQGFQNMANPPRGTHEFCTVSLLNSIRHGTGWHHRTNEKTSDPEPFEQHLEAVVEHVVQIDMCSAEPYVLPQVTAERAQILQLVAGSNIATEYFENATGGRLTCLYAEDAQDLAGFDETKSYTRRYMLRLHLAEKYDAHFDSDYFTKIDIKPMALDGSDRTEPGAIHYGEVDTITRNISTKDKEN